MLPTQNNFAAWSVLAREDPLRWVNTSVERANHLSPRSRDALIAALPERPLLLEQLRESIAEEDAPLAGVPYVLQDLFNVAGLPTRCGAPPPLLDFFEDTLEESALIDQSLKEKGAVLLAKTVPSEFGIGIRGRNRTFGDCPHADGDDLVCGGGAGSCATAVKGGWVPLAFGLDSSAGIRIPAAFHGLPGFRMGHNDFARQGVFPMVPSLESVGWLCTNLSDLQTMIETFYPIVESCTSRPPRGLRLENTGIPLTPSLETGFIHLGQKLETEEDPETSKALNHVFQEATEAFSVIEGRELFAVHQYWLEEYRNAYDEGLRHLIEGGQICTPGKAEEAAEAQQKIREYLVAFFREYDYLLMPISPCPNPSLEEWSGRLGNNIRCLNAPTSLSAFPALIVPFACASGRYSAAQLILNPRKVHLSAAIIKQLGGYGI